MPLRRWLNDSNPCFTPPHCTSNIDRRGKQMTIAANNMTEATKQSVSFFKSKWSFCLQRFFARRNNGRTKHSYASCCAHCILYMWVSVSVCHLSRLIVHRWRWHCCHSFRTVLRLDEKDLRSIRNHFIFELTFFFSLRFFSSASNRWTEKCC